MDRFVTCTSVESDNWRANKVTAASVPWLHQKIDPLHRHCHRPWLSGVLFLFLVVASGARAGRFFSVRSRPPRFQKSSCAPFV